jgi:signal transduction histidine kinase/ActR/RegA family two-component response regulator
MSTDLAHDGLLPDLLRVMSHASVGRFSERVVLDDDADYDDPLQASALMLNVLMEDLAYRDEKLRDARRREAEVEMHSAFLTAINHDIRTPISVMLGCAQVLSSMELDLNQQRLVDEMQSAGRHLISLVDDVLDFSKITFGGIEIGREPIDARAAVDETLMLLANDATRLGVTVDWHPGPEPLAGSGDSARLRQILVNLVGNAIKFSPNGHVEVTASIDPGDGEHPRTLHIAVRDDGIGMPQDSLDRIFEPFKQARDRPMSVSGTGIGLAICRSIVEAWGGTIDVESTVGTGSTFRLALDFPAVDAPHAATKPHGTARTNGALPSPSKVHVVVAEDHQTMRELTINLLSAMGPASISAVADGEELVALLGSEDQTWPGLIVADLRMQRMDGLEAIRSIRSMPQGGPPPYIVMLTASATEHDRRRSLEAGADDFIAKPPTIDQLRAMVTAAAERQGRVPHPQI